MLVCGDCSAGVLADDVWRVEGVPAARSGGVGGIRARNGYDGRSAGREESCFLENIGCRKNRGIARDLLYAEPARAGIRSSLESGIPVDGATSLQSLHASGRGRCLPPNHTRAHARLAAIKPQTAGLVQGSSGFISDTVSTRTRKSLLRPATVTGCLAEPAPLATHH